MDRKKEWTIKLVLFSLVTTVTFVFAFTFPNVPIIKSLFRGNVLVDFGQGDQLDERGLAWFNRDPDRDIPEEPNIILSPADGYVLATQEINNAKHVIIEMRWTDVHVQRFPMAGKVVEIKGGGKELEGEVNLSDYWKEKMMPFQRLTVLETEIGRVSVRQITSFFAKRIEVWVEPGQEVERGQRLGRVLNGSTVVIEVPDTVELLISKDDEVLGGETVIARYGRQG